MRRTESEMAAMRTVLPAVLSTVKAAGLALRWRRPRPNQLFMAQRSLFTGARNTFSAGPLPGLNTGLPAYSRAVSSPVFLSKTARKPLPETVVSSPLSDTVGLLPAAASACLASPAGFLTASCSAAIS
jgi:hypothetical protein